MGSAYAYAHETPSGRYIGHWIVDCCDDVGFNKIAVALLTRYDSVDKIERLIDQGEKAASELVFGESVKGRVQVLRKMIFDDVFEIESKIFTCRLEYFPDAFFLFRNGTWTFVEPCRSRYNGNEVWDIGNHCLFDDRFYKCSRWKILSKYVRGDDNA